MNRVKTSLAYNKAIFDITFTFLEHAKKQTKMQTVTLKPHLENVNMPHFAKSCVAWPISTPPPTNTIRVNNVNNLLLLLYPLSR